MNKTLLKVIAPLTASLALMVSPSVAHGKDNGLECLAMNVYHEARGQGLAGQVAVMHVTLNRVEDPRFPNNICGVVYQGPVRPSWKNNGTYIPIKNKCQFSWWCDGKSDKAKDVKSWNSIVSLVSWYLDHYRQRILTIQMAPYSIMLIMSLLHGLRQRSVLVELRIIYFIDGSR